MNKGRVVVFLNTPMRVSVLKALISESADDFVLDIDDCENVVIREG